MSPTPDVIATALKMVAALGVVLGALFVVFYFTRRLSKLDHPNSHKPLIRVLATKFIGVKKNICAIEVPGAVLILGVTSDHITLLTKIEEAAIVETIRDDQPTHNPTAFVDHLNKFMSRLKLNKGH